MDQVQPTCWGWQFIPLFTRFYTSQVVVWDVFHQEYDHETDTPEQNWKDNHKTNIPVAMEMPHHFNGKYGLKMVDLLLRCWIFGVYVESMSILITRGFPPEQRAETESHLQGFYQQGATRNPQRRIYEKLPKPSEISSMKASATQISSFVLESIATADSAAPYGELLRFDSPERVSE